MKANVLFILACAFLLSCSNRTQPVEQASKPTESADIILIKGSETARKIITSIDDFFKKANPGQPAEYTGGGSNLGIMSMMHNEADIIFVSRDLNPEEQTFFKNGNYEIDTIAIDGIAIVVNHKNPLKQISLPQVKEIYEGKVVNWQQIGGPNKPVKVYARESTSGTYTMFKDKVLGNANCMAAQTSLNYNEDIIAGVKKDEYSIGYVGLGYTLGNSVKVLGLYDTLSKTVMIPEYSNLKTGNYYLKRYIVAIYNPANEKIKKYVSCIHNENTYRIINESGFIPYRKSL